MGMTKFQKLVIVFLVILAALIFISTRTIIRGQDRILDETRYIKSEMRNEINRVANTVENTMEAFEKENLWYRTSDFEIEEVDATLENITIAYEVQLNEFGATDQLYLALKNTGTGDVIKTDLVRKDDSLTFEADATLEGSYNYEAEIIREVGSVMKSYQARGVYLADYIRELMNVDVDFEGSSYNHTNGSGSMTFNVYVFKENYQRYFKDIDLEITSIEADIYINRQLMETIDLLNDTKYAREKGDRRSVREFYNEKVLLEYTGTFTYDMELEEDEMFRDAVIVRVTDSTGRVFVALAGGHEDYEYYYEMLYGQLEEGQKIIQMNW